jgi:citrate synthase
MTQAVCEGLEGVLVARTELSLVDGAAGRLVVRGRAIEELVGQVTFEGMLALLLDGAPSSAELGQARQRAFALLAPRWSALCSPDAMTTLASALSLLPPHATPADALGVAALATAAWITGGLELTPDASLGHASDTLRLLRGGDVTVAEGALLDAYFVTVAEHGFNASTFATRVAASTGAPLPAALLAGVATLSGPLHGGAPGPVLDLLDAVARPERAPEYVRAELAAGRRIMGMGHRVYRVRDPRAFVLERALSHFQAGAGTGPRLELARAVEAAAEAELARRHPGRALRANVEFYTALVLEALGIPRAAFTAVFACARIAGYAAHYAEQRRTGRLIRPSALYVGPLTN